MATYVYGWVSPVINSNYAAWAVFKEEGSEDDAEQYYKNTCDTEAAKYLDWFCIKTEDAEIEWENSQQSQK